MTYADGSREIIDKRSLRTLGEVHDVLWKPKSGLYANGSDRSIVNELIERGFLKESPVEFSNRRNISITARGRTLYDALIVIQSIWTSDPDARLDFEVVGGVSGASSEKTPPEDRRESTNGPSEVSEVVLEGNAPQTGGIRIASGDGTDSGESEPSAANAPGASEEAERWSRPSPERPRCSTPACPPTTTIRPRLPRWRP